MNNVATGSTFKFVQSQTAAATPATRAVTLTGTADAYKMGAATSATKESFSSPLEWESSKPAEFKTFTDCGATIMGGGGVWYLPAGANAQQLFTAGLSGYKIAKGVTTGTQPTDKECADAIAAVIAAAKKAADDAAAAAAAAKKEANALLGSLATVAVSVFAASF